MHIHAFSPPEFVEFERFFKMDVRDIIRRLHAAGLDTIPGGGGEIFNPRVRRRIGIGKCSGDDWMRVMRVAHEEGMNTSCTMLIGHIEFVRERIEHMSALRDMQDYARALPIADCQLPIGKTREEVIEHARGRWPGVFGKSYDGSLGVTDSGSYTAFIHWPFQRENTPLGRARNGIRMCMGLMMILRMRIFCGGGWCGWRGRRNTFACWGSRGCFLTTLLRCRAVG